MQKLTLDTEYFKKLIKEISKEYKYQISKEFIDEVINLKFIPSFLTSFKVKTGNKNREVVVENIKDKIVEKALLEYIYPQFENCLNENNYAFVKNRSIFDAINKAFFYVQNLDAYYLKVDIKDFFENINHNTLTKMLLNKLDERIVYLIMLFFKNRKIFDLEYHFHNQGVHQGGVLSPFLSNIYLTPFDNFLQKNAKFVRFADDIIIFTKNPEKLLYKIKKYLNFFNLTLNEEKTSITTKSFVFLNIRFRKDSFYLENERFNKLISKLSKLNFLDALTVNNFLNSVSSYYDKVMNQKQKDILKNEFLKFLARAYIKEKFNYEEFNVSVLEISKKDIKKAIEEYKIKNLNKRVDNILNKQLNIYANLKSKSVVFVTKKGSSVGVSKNKVVIKYLGKVEKSFPLSLVEKILILNSHISISSNLILKANEKGINIEFIKNSTPYATINTFNSKIFEISFKQLNILSSSREEIAKEFLRGKLKNQLNYLKYLSKYHKHLKRYFKTLEELIKKLKLQKDIKDLFVIEANFANIYWQCIREVVDVEFEKRVTKGAVDVFNSSLNYAYAILYNTIQNALLKANLNIYISFLHSFQDNKPTLVYDLIEEFRAFVVDRTIVSMFNRNEPIEINNGILTLDSRKLIAKNIFEKLNSFTFYKGEKVKIENIIQQQAYLLRKFVEGKEKYKAFIGRY